MLSKEDESFTAIRVDSMVKEIVTKFVNGLHSTHLSVRFFVFI